MKHLLVIRLSALGDAAILASTLNGYDFSGLTVTVAAPPLLEPLFADIPGVQFLGVNKRQSAYKLYRIFRAVGADAVADMHHVNRVDRALLLLRLHALLHLKGLPIRHIRKGRFSRFLFLHHIDRRPRQRQSDRYADVMRRLGIFHTEPKEQQVVSAHSGCTTIGIAPFAQHEGKIWPLEYTAELVHKLTASGYRIILFCSHAEAPKLESLVSDTCRLADGSFASQLDTIRNLALMVSMDSANMHFASAVGTSVVSIWGATHPDFGFYGYGQDRANALCANLPCQPCSAYGQRPCRYGDHRCLRAVTPDAVIEKIVSLIPIQ